jgi:hypothetical protein
VIGAPFGGRRPDPGIDARTIALRVVPSIKLSGQDRSLNLLDLAATGRGKAEYHGDRPDRPAATLPYPEVRTSFTVAFGRDVRSDNRLEDTTWQS